MTPEMQDHISLPNEDASYDILEDIENNSNEKARQQRKFERISVKAKVVLQPGNSSEFLSYKVQGITGNISSGGCQVMFPIPVQVGDVYRLHFDNEKLNLPMVFVRCLRCRLIAEDAYEAGFVFFKEIPLPQSLRNKK